MVVILAHETGLGVVVGADRSNSEDVLVEASLLTISLMFSST